MTDPADISDRIAEAIQAWRSLSDEERRRVLSDIEHVYDCGRHERISSIAGLIALRNLACAAGEPEPATP